MLQDKIIFVCGGRGCFCCCKRNPPGISSHEGIWIGNVDHPVFCLNACANRKDSLGYMNCIDTNKEGSWISCSTLNNSDLAARVYDYRIKYPTIYPGIDTKKMREI